MDCLKGYFENEKKKLMLLIDPYLSSLDRETRL